jgi:hypothetical protein
MENFPPELNPDNIKSFKQLNTEYQFKYLRKYVTEKMLSKEFSIPDKCFIDLNKIHSGELGEINYGIDPQILVQIQNELEQLGWCTSSAYGGTILFIYTKDQIPKEIVNAKLLE